MCGSMLLSVRVVPDVKMSMDFDGFDQMIAKLEQMGDGRVKVGAEKALTETHALVTAQAQAAIAPHRQTGKTEASLSREASVEWEMEGKGSIEVGFDIANGGLPSVFLMHGTPKMKPDKNLYNAFFGSATQKKIEDAQRAALGSVIDGA